MSPFPIHDPYPETGALSDEDAEVFELDSNLSDEDAQELLREFRALDPTAVKRDLAAATIALQELHWGKWVLFCRTVKADPLSLLRKYDARVYMAYLIWWRRQHPRAQRLNTFESVWKSLRQLYYDKTQHTMPGDVGKLVTDYLHGEFCKRFELARGMMQTYTVGHNTLLGMLHYHWKFDTEIFLFERERVQLAAVLLFLAYTGARPGAIVESSAIGLRGSNEALLYRDVKLKLLQPPGHASLLVLEITIRLDKGKRNRPAPKTITLYENRECPAMCPIIHFLALAFADEAFHARLMEQGLTPSKMHGFQNQGRISMDFKFRDEILDIPIFRTYERRLEGIQVHPKKALSAKSIGEESKRLGQRAGLPHPFRPYCLRREVGTELTDRGVSDAQRNQIMGHARSETFLKHYISSSVVVDVQATFLGRESKSDLIKEMGKLTLRRDPNLPRKLNEKQKNLAHQTHEIIEARNDVAKAKHSILLEFTKLNQAPPDHPSTTAHKAAQKRLMRLKAQSERSIFKKMLHEFHSEADLSHMLLQLSGQAPLSSPMLIPVTHVISSRNQLASALFEPVKDDDTFAMIVKDMALLCRLVEERGAYASDPAIQKITNNEPSDTSVSQDNYQSEVANDGQVTQPVAPQSQLVPIDRIRRPEPFPLQSYVKSYKEKHQVKRRSRLSCLFCLGKPGRQQHFARSDNLRKHYRLQHFPYQIGSFFCPVPNCGTVVKDPGHFYAHAVKVHKSDLGVRASIMQVNHRCAKPGQLATFQL